MLASLLFVLQSPHDATSATHPLRITQPVIIVVAPVNYAAYMSELNFLVQPSSWFIV